MWKRIFCASVGVMGLAGFATTAHAGCKSGGQVCNSVSSSVSSYGGPLASYTSHTSYSSMDAMPAETSRIVPYESKVSSISNYRIEGMGDNEALAPTDCPVSVYNPEGGKVLGCYSVVKPKPIVKPQPVVRTQVRYNTVRVVRPIIYVRYPVPTPVPVQAPRPVCAPVAPVYPQYYGGCGW